MIPQSKHTHQIESNLDGEVIDMEVDPESIEFVIQALINQYSNVPFCVLREYSNNALDSHIEAGSPLPIQVTLPTQDSPTLHIKDFGTGLDANDIRQVYSKYGKSTKRATNAQQGSYGIGAKSALGYTSQFSVIGIKGGVLTQVAVGLDENGLGTQTIVHTFETDKANGVEIIIPVRQEDIKRFQNEADRLFRYWDPGTVLVDGEEPDRYEGLEVTPEITLIKGRDQDEYGYKRARPSYVIMANTPYPIDSHQFSFDLSEEYSIVAKIPNASVHVTPSREALDYTPRTRDFLTNLFENLKSALMEAVEREIEASPTAGDAVRTVLRWRSALPKMLAQHVFKYQQQEIPDTVKPPDGSVFLLTDGQEHKDYYGKRRGVGKHNTVRSIDLTIVSEAVWVWNFKRSFTPTVKRKLWHHFDQIKREYPPNFIMCSEKPDSVWIDPANVIKWDPVEAIKLPRTGKHGRTNSGRIPGSYDLYWYDGHQVIFLEDVPADDIDAETTLYWTRDDKDKVAANQAAKLAQLSDDEFMLVLLAHNRVTKFTRLFPESHEYQAALRCYHADFIDFLSDREKQLLVTDKVAARPYRTLPGRGIADPELARAKRLADEVLHSHEIERLRKMAHVFGNLAVDTKPVDLHTPLGRYPLTTDHYGYLIPGAKKHNLIYINAAYKELYADA